MESSSPAYIPQCWLSNSTAQAIALANVNPEVLVTIPESLSHFSLVTCLATKECLDWIFGYEREDRDLSEDDKESEDEAVVEEAKEEETVEVRQDKDLSEDDKYSEDEALAEEAVEIEEDISIQQEQAEVRDSEETNYYGRRPDVNPLLLR